MQQDQHRFRLVPHRLCWAEPTRTSRRALTRYWPELVCAVLAVALEQTAVAQERAPIMEPEAAARTVAPVDSRDAAPLSEERVAERGLDSYLDGRIEADRAALGQVPPGAATLEAALREAFDPSLAEIEGERLGDAALAVPRFLHDQVQRQAAVPTDETSRDPATPPMRSSEDEAVAARVAGLDPRRAAWFTTAVEVEVELDAHGRIFRQRVTRSSGRPALDRSARRAVAALAERRFGTTIARHVITIRLELIEQVTRWNVIGGTVEPGGDRGQAAVLGRGLAWRRVRVVRVRPPDSSDGDAPATEDDPSAD